MWEANCSLPSSFPSGVFVDYSAATDGSVAAVTCALAVKLFDLATGSEVANLNCNNCFGQPILTNDYVIVASSAGTVLINRQSQQSSIVSNDVGTLVLQGNTLFVTSMNNGGVVAFSL